MPAGMTVLPPPEDGMPTVTRIYRADVPVEARHRDGPVIAVRAFATHRGAEVTMEMVLAIGSIQIELSQAEAARLAEALRDAAEAEAGQ